MFLPMSDDAPAIPPTPERINRRELWTALLLPSGVTVAVNGFITLGGNIGDYGSNFLGTLGFTLVSIIMGAVLFSRAVKPRYHGRSLVLLNCFYILGQIIIGIGVWAGSCLGFMELR